MMGEVTLDFITTRNFGEIEALKKPAEEKKPRTAEEIREEIKLAIKYARAADTVGRYDWAVTLEDKAQKLMEELEEVTKNSTT